MRARILVTPLDELAPLGFAHDLFREVLGAMLSPAIKAQLHLTLARTLDQLRADGVPIAHSSVAAHYVGAASLGLRPAALEAVRHSEQAAFAAAGQLAFEDAACHLRRALAALQLADHPVAGVIEGASQRQQQVEPDVADGVVGELQRGEGAAQVAGGVFEGQLAGGVEGGLLGVPDRRQRGGSQAQ